MILAHMAMTKGGGNAKQNGGKCRIEGSRSRHGWQRWAGKAWHDKAVAANSRRMKWPAQALKQKQPTDDPTGTGLAVKYSQQMNDRHRPCSKHSQQMNDQHRPCSKTASR